MPSIGLVSHEIENQNSFCHAKTDWVINKKKPTPPAEWRNLHHVHRNRQLVYNMKVKKEQLSFTNRDERVSPLCELSTLSKKLGLYTAYEFAWETRTRKMCTLSGFKVSIRTTMTSEKYSTQIKTHSQKESTHVIIISLALYSV